MENDPVPGRTIVPLQDAETHVTFYLVARSDVTGLAARLFEWVKSVETGLQSADVPGHH